MHTLRSEEGVDSIRMMPQSIQLYLVISNISKRRNVRQLVQVAAAMEARILVVGQRKNWEEPPMGNLTEEKQTLVVAHFDKWRELVEYLQQHQIRLLGVEIHPDAVTVDEFVRQQQQQAEARTMLMLDKKEGQCGTHDGSGDIAVVVGNEGTGLSEKQMASCDQFVRIPQYGAGTASLNVYTAASIVLYKMRQQQMSLLPQQRQQHQQRGTETASSTVTDSLAT